MPDAAGGREFCTSCICAENIDVKQLDSKIEVTSMRLTYYYCRLGAFLFGGDAWQLLGAKSPTFLYARIHDIAGKKTEIVSQRKMQKRKFQSNQTIIRPHSWNQYLANIYVHIYLVNVSLGYLPTFIPPKSNAELYIRADVKKESFVGRDALAQGGWMAWHFPVIISVLRLRAGGKQPVACIVPGANRGLWWWMWFCIW